MGLLDELPFVERLQFFDGQRLFAPDLQGIDAFNREMRWLHNQSLHQPGIGNGFAVRGNKGDRQVTIGPGYAIDVAGKEIVLTETQVQPVPPVAGDAGGRSAFFDLAVSYPDDASLAPVETRDGICLPRGTVRRREEPLLCWVRLQRNELGVLTATTSLQAEIDRGTRIVIARAEILKCQLQSLSLAERRSARPAQQPRIACGLADPTPWTVVEESEQGALLTAPIDTTLAQFLNTPGYFASIAHSRLVTLTVVDSAMQVLLVDQLATTQPSPQGFTATLVVEAVPLSGSAGRELNEAVLKAVLRDWKVSWMGIEG